ncbi:MAG: hypothetical protein ABJH05_11575 [Fulvivirga sp.]
MAFLHSYIVFIINNNDELITGLTKDIDQVMDEYRNSDNNSSLVFQRHFDEKDQAEAFEKQLKHWDNEKKKALINGDIDIV